MQRSANSRGISSTEINCVRFMLLDFAVSKRKSNQHEQRTAEQREIQRMSMRESQRISMRTHHLVILSSIDHIITTIKEDERKRMRECERESESVRESERIKESEN